MFIPIPIRMYEYCDDDPLFNIKPNKNKVMKKTDLMPFGNLRGTPMDNVPAGYLINLHEKASVVVRKAFPQVFKFIKRNLNDLMEEHDKKE